MAALRGDQYVKLPSPSKALGMQRTVIRQSAPQGQDREQVSQIVDTLCRHHQLRAAAIVLLARATGMRLREAILADLSMYTEPLKSPPCAGFLVSACFVRALGAIFIVLMAFSVC